jgi:hypothetical protein
LTIFSTIIFKAFFWYVRRVLPEAEEKTISQRPAQTTSGDLPITPPCQHWQQFRKHLRKVMLLHLLDSERLMLRKEKPAPAETLKQALFLK